MCSTLDSSRRRAYTRWYHRHRGLCSSPRLVWAWPCFVRWRSTSWPELQAEAVQTCYRLSTAVVSSTSQQQQHDCRVSSTQWCRRAANSAQQLAGNCHKLSCFGSKLNRNLQITEFERICHMTFIIPLVVQASAGLRKPCDFILSLSLSPSSCNIAARTLRYPAYWLIARNCSVHHPTCR